MASTEPASSTGKLVRGAALFREVEGYKPVSSIPAKFETLLFTGPREKTGFSSSGRRFGDTEKENPGPGAYGADCSVSRLEYQKDSISKKGYGPMVSRTSRWKNRVVYSGPGPGEYKQKVADIEDFNRARTTAAFHTAVTPIKPIEKAVESGPGPGAYRAEDSTRTGQKLEWAAPNSTQTYASSFKTTPHKLHLGGNLESPPPTKYDVVDAWDPSSSANKASSRTPSKAGLSSFAGRSAGTSAGHADPGMYLVDPKEQSRQPDTGPGPGSYDSSSKDLRTKLEKQAGKKSANFLPPEYVDRFGRPLGGGGAGGASASDSDVAPLAGPGSGHASMHAPTQRRIDGPTKGVSAPFKSQLPSRADFDPRELGKAPGPAFYSPQKPATKSSFHLNARKRMVA